MDYSTVPIRAQLNCHDTFGDPKPPTPSNCLPCMDTPRLRHDDILYISQHFARVCLTESSVLEHSIILRSSTYYSYQTLSEMLNHQVRFRHTQHRLGRSSPVGEAGRSSRGSHFAFVEDLPHAKGLGLIATICAVN